MVMNPSSRERLSVPVVPILAIATVLLASALLATSGAMAQSCNDDDGDGYVDCVLCAQGPGVLCGECDESNPDVNPGAAESCNGIDDNCDGVIDDGFLVGMPCDGPDRDLCAEGTFSCDATGLSVVCNDATSSNQELCNGIDDECDGQVDSYAQACSVGFGVCARTGPASCAPGDLVPACHLVPGPGSEETCDGIDNNCDGRVDEDLVQPCSTACGQGSTKCVGGEWSACTARPCCDCVVGPTGDSPGICEAYNAGCTSMCVQPLP